MAIKVFSAESTDEEIEKARLVGPPRGTHPGQRHIELAIDSFVIRGPNGRHFCKVVEPLGRSLYAFLDEAFEKRSQLNEPEPWLQRVVNGDPWSVRSAKRACWQILQGLDYLHSQRLAHRDLHPGNVCSALQYDLASLSENQIQKTVWQIEDHDTSLEDAISDTNAGIKGHTQGPAVSKDGGPGKHDEMPHSKSNAHPDSSPTPDSKTDSETDSGSDSDSSLDTEQRMKSRERERSRKEAKKRRDMCEKAIAAQWRAFELGMSKADRLAEPHSAEWNRANFLHSRNNIELTVRADGKMPGPNEVHYTVAPTPLETDSHLEDDRFRLVLVDLGFACRFEDCEQQPRADAGLVDFMSPEWLMGLPTTYKADIFSAGLLFWEVVMLRRLVEARPDFGDSERLPRKSGLVRDLAQRLGPVPAGLRTFWKGASSILDSQGRALGLLELEGEEPEPDDYNYGDIWYQAKWRKPLNMSEDDMKLFVDLLLLMMQWTPESRPTTSELLRHEWFKELS